MNEVIGRIVDDNGGLLWSLLMEHRVSCSAKSDCPTEKWVTDSQEAIRNLDARLAAAECVVEAAREVRRKHPGNGETADLVLDKELRAYDSQNLNVGGPRPNDDTGARPADLDKRGRCVAGKGGCDSWRGHVDGCTADLNSVALSEKAPQISDRQEGE